MRGALALTLTNLRLALRDRTVLFFNYIFPLIFFFVFESLMTGGRGSSGSSYVFAMILVLGIMGNGLFGAGLRAVEERDKGILRRYRLAPITPAPLLISSLIVGYVLYLPLVLLLFVLANRIYRMDMPANPGSIFLFVTIGLLSFRSIGLILASMANSLQESQILTNLLYFPMLFLSGATFPIAMLPKWAQTISQFIPSTYLINGFQGILIRGEGLRHNGPSLAALIVTFLLCFFIAYKFFRWEREEKIPASAKLWVLGALLPFFVLGAWENFRGGETLKATQRVWREMRRSGMLAFSGGKIFVGNGDVIERGVLILDKGKIVAIFKEGEQTIPKDARTLNASGKTLLPGLCDIHVHLAVSGTYKLKEGEEEKKLKTIEDWMIQNLRSHLYCGVTAVKSVGDSLNFMQDLKRKLNGEEILAADLYAVGPMFTAPGGHGTEFFKYLPETIRQVAMSQAVREETDPDQARDHVRALAKAGVDGIKAILEAGSAGHLFPRLDLTVLRAIIEEAHQHGLKVVVHTGNSRDMADAIEAGADGLEHGSFRDHVPDSIFQAMAKRGIFYDPTLAVIDSLAHLSDPYFLEDPLVQQAVLPGVLKGFREWVQEITSQSKTGWEDIAQGLTMAKENLKRAYELRVPLSLGTDAANPGTFHGPSVHRELRLWVESGVPAEAALQAATRNNARLLGKISEFGTLEVGKQANVLVVNGNPLRDISATANISDVIYKGERLEREKLIRE